MNKSILFISFSLMVAYGNITNRHIITIVYREPEILYGNIRRIIELRSDIAKSEPALCPHDTTYFDKKGNILKTDLGTKAYLCTSITYENKFDQRGQKHITVIHFSDGDEIYRFNSNGVLKEADLQGAKTLYIGDEYGNVLQAVTYIDNKEFQRTNFKYDRSGYLNQKVTEMKTKKGSTSIKTIFQYINIDNHKNWTLRLSKNIDRRGRIINIDTVKRGISYF